MSANSRRLRFRQRIEIERQILAEVNGSLTMVRPLTGITELAVRQWCDDLKQQLSQDSADRISNLIIEIARRSSFDADCSRDVFDGEELVPSNTVGELLLKLKDTIFSTHSTQLGHTPLP